jgi:hypothetical protein
MPHENDRNTTINLGRTKQQITFDFVKWIVAIAFGAGMVYGTTKFESQDHAEKTYVKKELFEEFQKSNKESHDDMKVLLKEIRDNQNKTSHFKSKEN